MRKQIGRSGKENTDESLDEELTLDEFNSVSRREFLRLNSALILLAGTGACSRPDEPLDDRTAFRILRTEDLLSLQFTLQNLRIEHRYRKPSRLVRIRENEDALLFVGFPGQHIAEQTYQVLEDTRNDPVATPARSLIARPSRLAFRIPADLRAIDLTVESLLNWQQWEPQLAGLDGDNRLAPSANQSLIEVPYGLALSPDRASRWAHARYPVTHAGRTELWHTRLQTGRSGQPATVKILQPGYRTSEGFEGSLTDADRRDLAGKSASARTLILSPLGGWLDVRGEWQEGTIARWEHRASAGQDERVVIQRQDGHLFPFGHRATLMTVTEREVFAANQAQSTGTQPAAVLRKRDFIVIKEPQMRYSHDSMALQTITAEVLVTPALDVENRDAGAMWIETRAGEPYRFRFAARDWADEGIEFDAPAVFVSADGTEIDALELYDDGNYETHRLSDLRGQTAAVARFEDATNPDRDRWGEPLKKARTVGDTTLSLLNLRFNGDWSSPSTSTAPYACQTEAMQARIPSLEQYLNSELNQGWFNRLDPESADNPAEIFAVARDENRIPMYFDKQSERCGGLAAPSFDVDGLSRVLGPVGDTDSANGSSEMDWSRYLKEDRANLLGGFPLIDLLSNTDGKKSLIVPRFDFTVEQKDLEHESDEEEKDDKPALTYFEIGLALTWKVPINNGVDLTIIALEPQRNPDNDNSLMNLEIAAKTSKAVGKPDPEPQNGDAGDESNNRQPTINWSVSARLTNFDIQLKMGNKPLLTVGFAYLGVTLGPPKPDSKKKDGVEKEESNENPDPEKSDGQKKKSSISATIDHKISGIDAWGFLGYLQKILDAATHLPKLPRLPTRPDAPPPESGIAYPAKLPGLGSADINVTVGPIRVPEFKWLQFDVSNIAVSVGMGFYFFARSQKDSAETRVPDNEFSIRVADLDNPLTLVAEPWGGLAHLGLNFTTRKITGFQASVGVVYRFTLDLVVTEAKCEGSLAGVFTFVANDDGDRFDVDIVLKLSGKAKLWIAEVYLLIVAVGKWTNDYFAFRADVYVNIKLAFFTIPLHFAFEAQSGGAVGGGSKTGVGQDLPDSERLSENEWLEYRAAFAEAG